MTIALRVPIFANCCGPSAGAMRNAAISSSSAIALRFGPVTNSATGTRRVPRDRRDLDDRVGGEQRRQRRRPRATTVPRLPPTVPRLRICGDPTVRDAIARPGRRSPSSAIRRV